MMTATAGEQDVQAGWELLPHDADVVVHGWGPSPEAAFAQGALALTAVVTDAPVAAAAPVSLACQAPDIELLFVEWLNAIIYEMAVQGMLFARFEPAIAGGRLTATVWGEPVDRARHRPACEPKGATFTALSVTRDSAGRWSARCVVDV